LGFDENKHIIKSVIFLNLLEKNNLI
jgi:hypothetical protein